MKAILLMFDSLNRHMLPPYGCDWIHAPNFSRLAQRTATFDNSYICSMPCMPARRDLHTGRPNFLHRSWGPLEPFDDSMPRLLKENGVSSHLISDHYHYWEAGGATYHTQYSTWQFFRGQEGDPWMGQVGPSAADADGPYRRQGRVNRQFMQREADQPQAKTFDAGLDFIRRNIDEDNWFLQIETFDPHEPFFTQRHYQDLYREMVGEGRPLFDWPPYGKVKEDRELVEQCRGHYAALLSMCDAKLGDLLDEMDRQKMWDDTMLIVCTDHGFLLGEHDWWAKMVMPWYNPLAHTPFFVWDPRSGVLGERRQSLVQPAIDIGPSLLEFFDMEPTVDMTGKVLRQTVENDEPVRDAALFGLHGGMVNVTDGRYVYMRAAQDGNKPLYEYTLMPTHIREAFAPEELHEMELAPPFSFTKACKTLKIPGRKPMGGGQKEFPSALYDVQADPGQQAPLNDAATEARLVGQMRELMRQCDAPSDQYQRLGL
ncbi:MAG: arylsulfatase A-like enzyme [Planctomycetota bacterium]|jgi:arylsulfatase A-like enzyme